MSNICELTGARRSVGMNVSHSNRHTKREWHPNIKVRTYALPRLATEVTVKLSTRAVRTIDKLGGLEAAIRKAKDDVLSPKLLKIKRQLKAPPVKKEAAVAG